MFLSKIVRNGFPRRVIETAVVEVLERRQMLAATPTFTDTDGDVVSFQITGSGAITVNPANRNILVTGTTVKSTLTISVKRSATGDGYVTMGELRSYGPLLTVTAPNIDFTHEVTTNDKMQAVSKTDKISMTLGALRNTALYTGGQRVGTLKIADWSVQPDGQELHAPTIDQFIITGRADVAGTKANEYLPGNMSAVMILGDSTTTPSDMSVGSISVPGVFTDIEATGRVGTVVVGQIHGEWTATSFGAVTARRVAGSTVATGVITGEIKATGAPGVQTSIASLSAGSDLSSLSVTTVYGDIGQITATNQIVTCTILSAGAIGGVDCGLGLYASRIQSFNSIDHVKVPGMGDDVIEVGVATTFTGVATKAADFANPTASLGALRIPPSVLGNYSVVTATNEVSAPHIDIVRLRNLDSPASLQIYLLSRSSPTSISYLDTSTRYSIVWAAGTPSEPTLMQEILHYV